MVLGDPFEGRTSQTKTYQPHVSASYALAAPQDRLAAIVVDYILLIPFLSLALAPLKRIFYVGQILGDDFYFHFELFFAVLVFFIVCVSYQTIFIYYQGATPGKALLKIRVVSIWPGRKITLTEAILRAVVWWLETVLLFIPHLAVSAGHRRRPMHDRVADTVVVTHRWQAVAEPTVAESSFARGMMHAGVVAIFCFLATGLFETIHAYRRESAREVKADVECDLDEELAADIDHSKYETSTLQKQMALFAVGHLPTVCLRIQADRVLSRHPENGMAYLAKAFSYSDDPEQMDEYLEEVCRADHKSESCRFSSIVSAWNDGDWKETSEDLASLAPKAPDFIRFWAVRQFFKLRDFQRVVDLLEMTSVAQAYSDFVLEHRQKALWLLGRKAEARLIHQTHMAHLDLDAKLESTSWMCAQELKSGCDGIKAFACRQFSQMSHGREAQVMTTHARALTDIKTRLCSQERDLKIAEATLQAYPLQARDYVKALRMVRLGKSSLGREALMDLAESDDLTAITIEARLNLIEWSKQVEDLDPVLKMWRGQDPFQTGWAEVGEELMDRYIVFSAFNKSFDVGMSLLGSNLNQSSFLRKLAFVSEKSQHMQAARDLEKLLVHESNSRLPASEGGL